MAKKRILILGAGLSGLSVAWHLKKKKIDCRVFEKEAEVGGLCRSKRINGFTFDYDGHLLHFKQPYALAFVKDLLKDNLAEHRRSAWIYSFDRFTRYPFQVNLHGLPLKIANECLSAFIRAQNDGLAKKNGNFLRWIYSAFGTGIARHFMIPYNTKFWTVRPQELTCDWLEGMIPVPTLSQIIEGTVEESRRQFGYNAQFWYPKRGGINQLPLALAERLKDIHTGCCAQSISLARREVKFTSGRKEKFDLLISTIPLPELPHLLDEVPENIYAEFRKLKWNSVFNLNLGIEKKDDTGWHWVYFPQKESCFFRVGFPHNFSYDLVPENKSSLYVEISYSRHRPIDKKKIVSAVKRDLKKAGILADNDRVCAQDFNDIRYGYPLYDENYASSRKNVLDFLALNNFVSCGRYGGWRYMSMEDVILEGKEIAGRF